MKQSSSKHEKKVSIITLKKPVAPQNEYKKSAYTHPYTPPDHQLNIRRPLRRTLPDSPPQNKSKKSANPHPYTWSKNPYS